MSLLSLSLAALLAAAPSAAKTAAGPKSVTGAKLEVCSTAPMTGFYRTGECRTGPEDRGTHVVCAKMTKAFLSFTKSRGNDLSSPAPRYRFPGLKPGDKWCLCALRWKEALQNGVAPTVHLEATNAAALRYVDAATLEKHEAKK